MQALHYCPGCGTEIQPDDQFCTACGFPLSSDGKVEAKETSSITGEQQVPVVSGPAKQATASRFLPLIILLVAGAIVGIYFWQKNNDKSKTGVPEKNENTVAVPDTAKKDNPITVTPLPGSYSLDDYTGEWQIFESNQSGEMQPEESRSEEDLIIVNEKGRLFIYPRSKPEEKYSSDMNCGVPLGHVLTCRVKDKSDGSLLTLTLELSQAKDDLTISAIPDEPTEKMVVKLRKIK